MNRSGSTHLFHRLLGLQQSQKVLLAAILFTAVLIATHVIALTLSTQNVGLVLLLAVFLNARCFGATAGLLTTLVAGISFAYFFLGDYSFVIDHGADKMRLAMFCVVGAAAALLTARNRQQEAVLAASLEQLNLLARVFESSGEASVIVDRNNRIVTINDAFTRITGYSRGDICGSSPSILIGEKVTSGAYAELRNAIIEQGYWQGEFNGRRKNGERYPSWVSASAIYSDKPVIDNQPREITYCVASFTDITQHRARQQKIEHLVSHDALTDLPNRFMLNNCLEQMQANATRNERKLALLFIDLDRFKNINDTLGHSGGDQLLIEAGRRLQSCIRASDMVARQGGDEFIVVLTALEAVTDVVPVIEKILLVLAQPYRINDHELFSSASIGISIFPDDGDSGAVLLKHADMAMYHAKADGRDRFCFYTDAMNSAARERIDIETHLRAAIAAEQFVLHYQPQIDVVTGLVAGMEALVRWQHPERGMISPLAFIPIAEESGLIVPLGAWVIDAACRQRRAWLDQGLDDLRISINLSARQLQQSDLLAQITASLVACQLSPELIELEITESVAMEKPAETILLLDQFRAMGITVSIDDFGTGYSSLSYLKTFPISSLKLDRSFVKDIESDANDAAICSASIALAHNLGLVVVAEGVETQAQHDYLKQLGCDFIQGYFFSKPLPHSEAFEFVRARNDLARHSAPSE